MPTRQPKRRDAQVWLGEFNTQLQQWLLSQRTEQGYLQQAIVSLHSMLEREPEVADTVSNLCASLLHYHVSVIRPDLVDRMARLGLEAEQMRADNHPSRWAERAMLQLARAQAAKAQFQRFAATRALRAIKLPQLDDETPAGCLRRFLGARVEGELADLLESGLDRSHTLERARAAVDACDWLTNPETRLSLLLQGLAEVLHGTPAVPIEALKALLQLTRRDLSSIEISNSVRAVRCAVFLDPAGASNPVLAAEVEDALERMQRKGVGKLRPADLIGLFHHASEDLAHTIIELVPAVADKVGLDPQPFELLLRAAAAAYADIPASARDSLAPDAAELEALEDPATQAIGLGLLLVAKSHDGGDEWPEQGDGFLRALDRLASEDADAAQDWRVRAELDEPIGVLARAAAWRLKPGGKRAGYLNLARLLDGLRVPPSRAQAWLSLATHDRPDPALLKRARGHAQDLFARLVFALRRWPEAVAIILQVSRGRTLFVCVTGKGVKSFESGTEFNAAAVAATELLAEQMAGYDDLGIPPDDAAIEAAGRAAHDAVPEAVRKLLARSSVALVCPDFRADAAATPFELMHDGSNWLGISRVIARLPSLEALVRTAEGSRRRVLEKRALSLAIARPVDHPPPLPQAEREVAEVRKRLLAETWDAPVITEDRIDPMFIIYRTSFAAHMHIAAHGLAEGGEELLVLSHGTRLTPDDVLGGSYGCTPTVWLNTCDLGQTTYLGAGAVRGVAQAFLEAGSPAVIANLMPVDDAVSSRLAQRFYDHAAQHDFGEALRLARRDLAADGISPLLWGLTVLNGDPRVTLLPSPAPSSGWENALTNAIGERDQVRQLDFIGVAFESMLAEQNDPRLAAALALVNAIQEAVAKSNPNDPFLLARACELCLQLQAHDAAAMAAFMLSEATVGADPQVSLAITEGAIALLRPVEAMESDWRTLTDRLLVRADQLRQGERAVRTQVRAPQGTSADEIAELQRMGDVLMVSKLSIDLRSRWYGLAPTPRSEETSSSDMLWNAVLASRTKSFEDMPETIAYSRLVAQKLAGAGEFSPQRAPEAAVLLGGLLKWLWGEQNAVAVEREMVESQTRVVQLALSSFKENWSPGEPWMTLVSNYADEIRGLLGALDGLPYDTELYVQMDKAKERIEESGLQRLERVAAEYPERAPDAMAYLLGTLIEVNTYSFTDGSVPESISERLNSVHYELTMKAEGYFMPWLMEGFKAVREALPDELERWLYFESGRKPASAEDVGASQSGSSSRVGVVP